MRRAPAIYEKHKERAVGAIVLHAGVNDIRHRQSEILKADFAALIKDTKERTPSAKIFVSGLLPLIRRSNEYYSRLLGLNNWLQGFCKKKDVGFIKNWNLFLERLCLFKRDGLHPNSFGARVLSENISKMVEQMPLTESWPFVDMGEEEHHDQRWPVACKKALGQGTHFLYHSYRTPINMSIEVITIDQRTVTYRVVSMPGDSTYLFHSLCYILHNHIRLTLDIWRNIVSYVLNDWDRFKVWTDDGTGDNYTTQEHYKSEILKPFTYGSACEFMAAAELFSCRFQVYQSGQIFYTFGQSPMPLKHLRFTGDDLSNGHFDVYECLNSQKLDVKLSMKPVVCLQRLTDAECHINTSPGNTNPGEHNKVPLEIVLLQRACAKPSCKSVIQMFGCFFGCYRTFIVMELLDSTMSLQDFIKMGPMKKPRAERAFGQIVQAVLHSHSRGVFHNDLKAGNILYQTTTGQIKLGIDFAMET
ncbi:PIM3 kinase, partial [Polypterus senegalus]